MIGAYVLRELNSERERAQNPAAGKKTYLRRDLVGRAPQNLTGRRLLSRAVVCYSSGPGVYVEIGSLEFICFHITQDS